MISQRNCILSGEILWNSVPYVRCDSLRCLSDDFHPRYSRVPCLVCYARSCSSNCCQSLTFGWEIRASTVIGGHCIGFLFSQGRGFSKSTRRQRGAYFCAAASSSESLYDILGVPPTASERDIKRAYRKLALKYHPDVNKEPDAQQKFMSIKTAYQTLVDSTSRSKYDSRRHSRSNDYGFSWGPSTKKEQQEDFYGVDDFFRDLQVDFQKRAESGQPKSLWEELAEIGEEFVEFLEKELSIGDDTNQSEWDKESAYGFDSRKEQTLNSDDNMKPNADTEPKSKEDINEIEDLLAKLKQELGL